MLANVLRLHGGSRTGPKSTAYLPPVVGPPPLSVRYWLSELARLHGVGSHEAEELLRRFEFEGALRGPAHHLSTGNVRKVLLAATLTTRNRTVILDEPVSALDAAGHRVLCDVVRAHAATGTSIVIAEHDVAWLRDVADRIVTLHDGRIAPGESAAGPDAATIVLTGPSARSSELLDLA